MEGNGPHGSGRSSTSGSVVAGLRPSHWARCAMTSPATAIQPVAAMAASATSTRPQRSRPGPNRPGREPANAHLAQRTVAGKVDRDLDGAPVSIADRGRPQVVVVERRWSSGWNLRNREPSSGRAAIRRRGPSARCALARLHGVGHPEVVRRGSNAPTRPRARSRSSAVKYPPLASLAAGGGGSSHTVGRVQAGTRAARPSARGSAGDPRARGSRRSGRAATAVRAARALPPTRARDLVICVATRTVLSSAVHGKRRFVVASSDGPRSGLWWNCRAFVRRHSYPLFLHEP